MTAIENITIRRAAQGDAVAATSCTEAAYVKYVERLGRAPEPTTADYGEVVAEHQVWVAESAGICLAALVLMVRADHMLIYSIAVDPEHQGRGLGRSLMALAEDEARRRNVDELRLYTNERMAENVGFYARLGYCETERRPHETHKGSTLVFMPSWLATKPRRS
jgi:ribosomal protein S18 acetylase RimI-like enzyme